MTANEPIYLDYAAATPVDERVLEAMAPYHARCFANPSASYAPARKVRADVEDARARIAHLMGAKPANVIFTAGATEANNLALTAAAPDAHVIASAIEHASVRACVEARALGTLLPVDGEGLVDPEVLRASIRPDTELVSIAYANGEIGTIQPLREIAGVIVDERARRLATGEGRPIFLHTDASQAAALKSLNVSSLGADLVTVSAAKLYGPKQVGMLWVRSGIELHPLVCGGGQEGGLRSGTENVPGIMGFVRAFEIACELRDAEARRLRELRDWLQGQLTTAFEDVIVAGPARECRASGQPAPRLLPWPARPSSGHPARPARRLRWYGVGMRREQDDGVTVLEAIGVSPEVAEGSLRITLGRDTTREQVERAARVIIEVVRAERQRVGMA